MRRRLRRPSGKQALERWLSSKPPRSDLIAAYSVRAYSDRDGDPVLSIDVVPTTEALSDVERRRRLFTYTRDSHTRPGGRLRAISTWSTLSPDSPREPPDRCRLAGRSSLAVPAGR